MTASESSPKTTESRARSFLTRAALLLDVWTANGGGRDRPADHAGDRDQGQHVGQGVEDDRYRAALGEVVGQSIAERAREAEKQTGRKGAERPPLAEDQGGECDEAPAPGDVLVERVHETERKIRAAHGREAPRRDHSGVTGRIDGDADRVRRAGVLPDRPDAKADRRPEHDDVREDEEE